MSYYKVPVKILLKIRNSSHMWPFFIFNNKDTCRLTLSSRYLSLSAWDSEKVFIFFETLPFSLLHWTNDLRSQQGLLTPSQSPQIKIVNVFCKSNTESNTAVISWNSTSLGENLLIFQKVESQILFLSKSRDISAQQEILDGIFWPALCRRSD